MIKKMVDYIGNPQYAKQRKWIGYAMLLVALVSDFLVPRGHALYIWEEIPGFHAVYGLIACVLIILVSKFLGHQGGIMKKEDYYD